ncbi:flagellar basal body rod protein FlgB [Paenibacillus yanchengensis]|uniref:Flagellar basal body rod protein FlgB n=1 Tax=Paenibacillus yanchengensis TaxID=2035833 RepID=A0ABW4YM75_9BACL
MEILNSASFQRLQGAVKASEMRQRVISNNIANVETPHFKRAEVIFESMLEQSLKSGSLENHVGKKTDSRHFDIGITSGNMPIPKVVVDERTVMGNHKNNVDVDSEMSLLAKNQLNYSFYVQQLNHEMKMMNIAIEGRG